MGAAHPNKHKAIGDTGASGSSERVRRDRGGRRGTGQSGAALVEFALVALLLFGLVFGIIDFGLAFNNWISLRQGTRDGVRQAVTGRVGTNQSCVIQGGDPANASVEKVVCLTKQRVGLNEDRTRVAIRLEGGAGTYSTSKSVAVCVIYPLHSVTGFLGPLLDDRLLRTEVQMRIEQRTDQLTPPVTPGLDDYSESLAGLPPGSSWSFCTAEPT